MLKIDRHSYILEELKKKHLVRVSKLAKDMKVTEMTIRRDLQELEDYGHLTRIHGGAKLKPKNFYQEDNYNKKISVNVEEKKQIARKVADLVKDNETIFIGAGSTTSYLAEYLQDRNINIVTNSMIVFEQFKDNPSCDLIFILCYFSIYLISTLGLIIHNISLLIVFSFLEISSIFILSPNISTTSPTLTFLPVTSTII